MPTKYISFIHKDLEAPKIGNKSPSLPIIKEDRIPSGNDQFIHQTLGLITPEIDEIKDKVLIRGNQENFPRESKNNKTTGWLGLSVFMIFTVYLFNN